MRSASRDCPGPPRAQASKKGVSAAEKRKRLLEIFHEQPVRPYQLKDLERIAPKAKQVVQQAVKDVTMELYHDNLINMEKIGTSTYFWSFPSAVAQAKRVRLQDLERDEQQCVEYEARQKALLAEAEAAIVVPPSAPEYQQRVQQLERVKRERAALEAKVKSGDENEAEQLRRMASALPRMKEGVNRWTDNIAIYKSYFVKKQGMDKAQFDSWMGIRGGSFFETLD